MTSESGTVSACRRDPPDRHDSSAFPDVPPLAPRRAQPASACGRLCLHRKRINISTVLAGQKLGIKEVDEGIWLASFMHYDLGYFDLEQKTLQPLDNLIGTSLSPMSQVRFVTDVSGLDKICSGAARGIRTPDPVITNDVLYQLSYCGEPARARLRAGGERVAT